MQSYRNAPSFGVFRDDIRLVISEAKKNAVRRVLSPSSPAWPLRYVTGLPRPVRQVERGRTVADVADLYVPSFGEERTDEHPDVHRFALECYVGAAQDIVEDA